MSDLPRETEPLEQTVSRWARKLRASSGWTVETVLATSENLLIALKELSPHGAQARVLLAREARLSRAMMSKLESIGHHAGLLRPCAANLPPYVSSLYVLTRLPFAQFKKAIATDLRGLSRVEIARIFTPAQPGLPGPRRRLATVRAPAGLADQKRRAVLADLRAALARIGEAHGIDLAVSPRGRRTRPAKRASAKQDVVIR